jgi:hypothetical protein
VSSVPAEIAGIGSTQQRLRVSPGFDPRDAGGAAALLKAAVGPDEYFVLSRIDGTQPLREILLNCGLPVEHCVAIVTRLRSIGALLLPGESSAPSPASPPSGTQPPNPTPNRLPQVTPSAATPIPSFGTPPAISRAPTPMNPMSIPAGTGPVKHTSTNVPAIRPSPPPMSADPPTTGAAPPPPMVLNHDLRLHNPSSDELAALTAQHDMGDTERRRILAIARLVASHADPYALLGVPPQTDVRDVKRAYFQLSKDIHPDRYYGRKVGSFGDRMADVFEACARAYARLTGSGRATSQAGMSAQDDDQPQTQQDYAAELFDRACNVEIGGDALGAMKLFAAAIRVDPQMRYLRRAANCALIAGQPRTALEYAKKAQNLAPTDPSAARLLATAFRAAGKLSDAEDILVMAMALKTENDALAAELRHDLAEVRRLLAQ